MSLERTALRLATAMALSNGMQAPFPTIAQDRVYDSRMDPIEGLEERELVPLVLVYTDDDDNEALSNNNGGPPWRSTVNLVMELSVGMAAAGEGGLEVVPITTEPELEAMLDLLEEQVRRVFREPHGAWSRRLYDDHIVRIESWSSSRFVERDSNARLAVRQIVARVMLPQPEEPAAAGVIPPPLGPLLETVITDGGPYATSAQALADLLTDHGGFTPIALPPLERVRLKETDGGGGIRPDGVGEADLT